MNSLHPEDPLLRLRRETASAHQQLEAQLQLPDRLLAAPPDQRRSDYVWLLERFFGLYEPLEQALATAHHPFAQPPRRTAWLVADLRALGLGDAELAAIPRCERIPVLATPGQALGAAYVLEGASLGGRLIARDLAHLPTSFFGSGGENVGARWHAFRRTAREWLAGCTSAGDGSGDCGAHEEVIDAANDTFDTFRLWTGTWPTGRIAA